MSKIRVLELCAGYGSQALALKNLGFDVYSEIAEFDKYASQAYMQLHGETKNYGDIYTIDETKLPYFDMITYSTPCQDFSVAGKGKGGDKGSGTRSSLLWECERIIRAVKPKYLLMENVKNLLSDKHRHNFNEWLKVLESMGYTNYYKVLNAKDYGIPQNRERIFCVSILGGGQYLFPNPIPLEKRLKDMLELTVAEKFYLAWDKIKNFLKFGKIKEKDICNTILGGGRGSVDEKHAWDIVVEPKVIQVGNIVSTGNWDNPQRGRIYSSEGCSPTINTCQGGGLEPKIVIGSTQKNAYIGSVENHSPCLTSAMGMGGGQIPMIANSYRIRKLTPRECFRLMGVKDEQFNKLKGLSDSQLYKMAGNSIVVNVLEEIFKNLLTDKSKEEKGQLRLI